MVVHMTGRRGGSRRPGHGNSESKRPKKREYDQMKKASGSSDRKSGQEELDCKGSYKPGKDA